MNELAVEEASIPDLETILKEATSRLQRNTATQLRNCLNKAGITTLEKLLSSSPVDLLKIKHFGRKSLRTLRETLAIHRLTLKEDVKYGSPPITVLAALIHSHEEKLNQTTKLLESLRMRQAIIAERLEAVLQQLNVVLDQFFTPQPATESVSSNAEKAPPSSNLEDPVMNARDIHKAMGKRVSLRQIYRAWEAGTLHCVRIGRRRLARLSWVEAWLSRAEGEE
jgi:hypothetical protein